MRVVLAAFALLLLPRVAAAQDVHFEQLIAPAAGSTLGTCVDTDGSRLVVSGGTPTGGTALVYALDGTGTWVADGPALVPPATDDAPYYGITCAILGDYLFVASPNADGDAGAIYVYHRDAGGTWGQTQRLTFMHGELGSTMRVHGTTLATSSPFYGPIPVVGRVFMYERDASGMYVQTAVLGATIAGDSQLFGLGMDFDGTTVLAVDRQQEQVETATYAYSGGASGTLTGGYIYHRSSFSGPAPGDAWGDGIAIAGDGTVFIAATRESSNNGATYAISPGHTLVLTDNGTPRSPDRAYFGHGITADGRWAAAIGTGGDVHAYHQSAGGTWTTMVLSPPAGVALSDGFGSGGSHGVAITGHRMTVGLPYYASSVGAAIVYHLRDEDGSSCSEDADCVSGVCADGICCHTDCSGACMSCRGADTGGADGTCAATLVCDDAGVPDAGDVDLGMSTDGGGTDAATTDGGTSLDGGGADATAGDGGALSDGGLRPRPELSCFCSTAGAGGGRGGGLAALFGLLALGVVVVARRRATQVARRRATRVATLLVALSVGALGASVAHAQHHAATDAGVAPPPTDPNVAAAREHFRLGSDHYTHGRFAEAATEYEAAYALAPRPALLHNVYLARRDMGDVRGAVEALRRYLVEANDLSEDDRAMLGGRLRAMEASLAHAGTSSGTGTGSGTGTSTGTGTGDTQVAPPPHHDDTPPPPHHDATPPPPHHAATPPPPATSTSTSNGDLATVGWVLLASSAVPAIVAVIAGAAMMDEKNGLYSMCTAGTTGDLCPAGVDIDGPKSRFELDRGLMWTGIGLAAALAATGVVLAIVGQPSSEHAPPATPTVACTSDGCGVGLAGSF